MEKEENKRVVRNFVITYFDKMLGDDVIDALIRDGMATDDDRERLKESSIPCIRIEHDTCLFAMELPYYSRMYHNIEAFGDNDDDALYNLLYHIMELATVIGDAEFFRDVRDAKLRYHDRIGNAMKGDNL